MVADLPPFDSDELLQRDWQKSVEEVVASNWPGKAPEGEDVEISCRAAIATQVEFGCSHVILPAPLLTEREDEGATLAQWLDTGLSVASTLEVGQPLLATIALHEAALNDAAFNEGGFLDAIVDHVTARDGFGGAYVVIASGTTPDHPFKTDVRVHRAYMHLSKALHEGGVDVVLLNFADIFGFACMAVGATDIATGSSQSRRRLALAAFRDEGGGRAVPHYYSHKVVGEFASETDLGPIRDKRLLRRIAEATAHSEDLLEALRAGGSASQLPAWVESQNNLTVAQRHFVCRLAVEGRRIRALRPSQRYDAIHDWLEEAAASVLYMKRRMRLPEIGRVAPTDEWLELLERISGN